LKKTVHRLPSIVNPIVAKKLWIIDSPRSPARTKNGLNGKARTAPALVFASYLKFSPHLPLSPGFETVSQSEKRAVIPAKAGIQF
jgi:hypothetical protein